MIQDINPHKFDLTYGQPKAQDEDFVLYIKKSKTLLRKVDEENHKIPKFSDFPEDKELLKEASLLPPPAIEMGEELKKRGVRVEGTPMTIEGLVDAICR